MSVPQRDFGGIFDWFSLASSALVPVASDSGLGRKHIAVSHSGKYASGVTADSGDWLNPSVTYNIVENTTVSLTLGKAFQAGFSAGVMIVSGYMIVRAVVSTVFGKYPQLVVSAVANEGVDAINTFQVSIPVLAAPSAQNLLSAFSGGSLSTCSMAAVCDPVVCEENTRAGLEPATLCRITKESPPTAPALWTLRASNPRPPD